MGRRLPPLPTFIPHHLPLQPLLPHPLRCLWSHGHHRSSSMYGSVTPKRGGYYRCTEKRSQNTRFHEVGRRAKTGQSVCEIIAWKGESNTHFLASNGRGTRFLTSEEKGSCFGLGQRGDLLSSFGIKENQGTKKKKRNQLINNSNLFISE